MIVPLVITFNAPKLILTLPVSVIDPVWSVIVPNFPDVLACTIPADTFPVVVTSFAPNDTPDDDVNICDAEMVREPMVAELAPVIVPLATDIPDTDNDAAVIPALVLSELVPKLMDDIVELITPSVRRSAPIAIDVPALRTPHDTVPLVTRFVVTSEMLPPVSTMLPLDNTSVDPTVALTTPVKTPDPREAVPSVTTVPRTVVPTTVDAVTVPLVRTF